MMHIQEQEIKRLIFVMLTAFLCISFIITVPVKANWYNATLGVCAVKLQSNFPIYDAGSGEFNASVGQTLAVQFYQLGSNSYTNPWYSGSTYSCGNQGGCPFEKTYTITEGNNNTVINFAIACFSGGTFNLGFVNVSGITQAPPVVDFSFSPSSGSAFAPLNVTFTDLSSPSATSWSWDFGDLGTSNQKNPVHEYLNDGTYNVTLTATNSYGTGSLMKQYIVNAYAAPSCGFIYSPNNGTSPLQVTFTDTSTSDPTSWYWNFDPAEIGGLTVIPSITNTSQNPTVTFSGSGVLPILHQVSNPAGSDICPTQYVNMSGPSVTPTPTPGIPFPNQTGVCIGSQISVGSGYNTVYNSYGVLNYPNGGYKQSFYPANTNRFDIGDTLQLGQYVYNEFNESGSLEWRMSYITEICNLTSPTPTITVTSTVTNTLPVYPTVTFIYPTNTPSYPLLNQTGFPTFTNISTLPPSLPQMPEVANSTSWRNDVCRVPYAGVLYCPVVDSITTVLTTVNTLMFWVIQFGISPIVMIVSAINFGNQTFFGILGMFSALIGIIVSVMAQIVGALPDKVKNVITFILIVDMLMDAYDSWDWVA